MLLQPSYLKHFRCDGRLCASRCCRDWSVAIDAETYGRYERLAPADRAGILPLMEAAEDGLFHVRLTEGRRCPFLRADGLCRLQRDYGEEYLSDICYSYPRVTYRIGAVVERSLAVTCPVAARLVLLSGEPLRFEERPLLPARLGWHFDMTKKVRPFPAAWRKLQQAGLRLLQDSSLPFERRLLALLRFFHATDRLAAKGDDAALASLWERNAFPPAAPPDFVTPSAAEALALYADTMMAVFHRLYGMPQSSERAAALLDALRRRGAAAREELWQRFPFAAENYAANEFFLRLYPYAFSGSFLHNAKLFVLAWKTVEFSLLMSAMDAPGRMDEERLLLVIDRVTERLDHSRSGMRALHAYVQEAFPEEHPERFAAFLLQIHSPSEGL